MTDAAEDGPGTRSDGPFDIVLPPRPYPGLRAFEKAEWPIFFGRELITGEIIERLATNQFIALHGDSGCGKSSLIRAGVLPRLETDYARGGVTWRTTDMLPRNAPLRHLAGALARLEQDPPDPDRAIHFRRLLNLGRKAAPAVAAELDCSVDRFVCILVDQFEEIFQLAYRGRVGEAQQFVEVLIGFQQTPPPGIHVILTMRSEFLGSCARFGDLAQAINDTQFLLPNMTREALLRAIREPAHLYGGHVERGLAEAIIDEAGGGQDQLPLIQHAMLLLQSRHAPDAATPGATGDWTLSEEHYRTTGGLGRLLSDHAEQVLQEVADAASEAGMTADAALTILERMFRALTGIDPDGRAVRRPQTIAELTDLTGIGRDTLLGLIAPLTADGVSFLRIYGQHPYPDDALIDISHEALIRNWRRLQDWCEREAQDGAIYQRLQALAADHRNEPDLMLGVREARDRDLWWHRTGVTPAWAARHGTRLPDVGPEEIRALLDLSLDSEAQEFQFWCEQTDYARALWDDAGRDDSALLAGLVLVQAEDWLTRRGDAIDANTRQFIDCSREHRTAIERERNLLERRNRTMLYGFSVIGFCLALFAGWKWYEAEDARMEAIEQKSLAEAAGEEAIEQEKYARIALEFSRKRYEAADDALRQAIIPQARRLTDIARTHLRNGDATGAVLLYMAAFSVLPDDPLAWPGDSRRYTGEIEKYLYAATGALRQQRVLDRHDSAVNWVVFSPDGTRIATAGDDGTVRISDAGSGTGIAVLRGHAGGILAATFSPDGGRIATGGADGTVRIWDTADWGEAAVLTSHTGAVRSLAFSPNGTRLVSGSAGGAARIWDAVTAAELRVVAETASGIRDVAFSPDGTQVVTVSTDNSVAFHDAETGDLTRTVDTAGEDVLSVESLPDGVRVTTVADDGTATIRNAESSTRVATLSGHRDRVDAVAFSTDGGMVATASTDGTIRLWRPATGQEIAVLRRPRENVRAVSFAATGNRLATAADDGTVRVWTIYPDIKDLIRRVQDLVNRCLGQAERAAVYLPPEPPRWCIVGPEAGETGDPDPSQAKPPYDTQEWRDWLAATERGEERPMPSDRALR